MSFNITAATFNDFPPKQWSYTAGIMLENLTFLCITENFPFKYKFCLQMMEHMSYNTAAFFSI